MINNDDKKKLFHFILIEFKLLYLSFCDLVFFFLFLFNSYVSYMNNILNI